MTEGITAVWCKFLVFGVTTERLTSIKMTFCRTAGYVLLDDKKIEGILEDLRVEALDGELM
jgi:hypothetical protein